jgi:glycosyltransferase involved in cell wall biosynthesis
MFLLFMQISPVIITKNAARSIAQTLESLKEFEEVIVYDTGSDDQTLEIARHYNNVKLCKGNFTGFGRTKNKAALMAKNDWIFSIDADEVVSPQLMESINNLNLTNSCAYQIRRYNYYKKKRIRFSGWGQECIVRIYNKTITSFNEQLVHEQVMNANVKTLKLEGELRHFSYASISDFVVKRNFYSELFAKQHTGKRKSSPFIALIKSVFHFQHTYIVKLGILDGYRGLLIAFSNAAETFYRYLKLYEMNLGNNKKVSLIITTYNWKEALEITIKSAINQSIAPEEIIIADDGSREDTREIIEKYAQKSHIPIIHSWQEDKGFRLARSRNLAISKARYEYIIFVDGDLFLHKNFVSDHLKNARKGHFLQGSRVLISENLTNKIIQDRIFSRPSFFSKEIGNNFNSINSPFLSWVFSLKKSQSHNSIRGCNFSFNKEDLLKVNGFNEDFKSWGREDSELVERLYNAGIYRKNLKFAGIQYHLYHKIGKTNTENDHILNQAIAGKLVWCNNGLAQHY